MRRRIFGTKREEVTGIWKIKIEQLNNWHFNKRFTVIKLNV
jgi:hypothetical protein